jgi:predicted AlkP superfamily pyrophosphatase or phosphodiesterase
MNSGSATLMICIDAFSSTYLSRENTPFMLELASKGVSSSIVPLFAFRGIETTMFTGILPDLHGIWTEICLREQKYHVSRNIGKTLVRLLDIVGSDKARKLGRVAVQCMLDRTSVRLTPNLIPASAFGYFEPSQKKAIFEPGSAGPTISTLFDSLRHSSLDFAFVEPSFVKGDRGVLDKVANISGTSRDVKFWYLKFGSPDKAGHLYGPVPDQIGIILKETDRYLQQVIEILQRKYSNLEIMIMADHGMSAVNSYIDIMHDLKGLRSTLFEDYLVFLDSTMARFWFFNDKARSEVEDYLAGLKVGHILSKREFRELHIPQDEKYGQLVFVIDEGEMIYPDFWSGTRKARGMHGYAFPVTAQALPVLVLNSEMSKHCKVKEKITYADIHHMIQNSLMECC